MKKWLSLIMVLAMLVCMTACKDTSDLPQDSTTTVTTPSSSPADYLTAVLEDEQTFVYNGEEMNLSHVLANYEDAIGRYALVDMDSDKQPEIAVEFDSQNFILVLHKDSDAYYGYLFTFRSMYQLNSDGSFYWNSGAGNHGCSRLVFKGNEYEKVELWRAERSEDGSEAYYVEGNKVSKEDFESVAEEKKEPVAWVAWADTPTDDEARNLCVAKMQQAYQIEVWYMSMDYPMGIDMLPAGTAVTYLDGTPYTLDHEYYRLADSLPEADRAVTTTAAALKQYLETVYTVDAIATEYYHSSAWVVYQGEVYRVAAEGMWHHRSLDTIRVTNKTADAITFTIDGLEDEPTEEHTLRYIDGNWKFDELV